FNPVTETITSSIRQSGSFIVVENRVDFADVQNLSGEMQRAIRTLASQGIVSGASPTHFAPDQTVTRAQIAAMYTRMLGIYDPNSTVNFEDVQRGDWFSGSVGTAYRHRLMTGTSPTHFSPNMNTPRDQLTAISARVLRNRMRYRDPADPMALLRTEFNDYEQLAGWSITDIALATRENLVIPRADGNFAPTGTMTRGEAALMLYRLYLRLW
ncbi:MAG: S-layer homology domain-containing protein, partial [Defluviitaleaceae bacterium]|nr:S-layer homology domain-containing protein [Defluviitaleaceae bacterium]